MLTKLFSLHQDYVLLVYMLLLYVYKIILITSRLCLISLHTPIIYVYKIILITSRLCLISLHALIIYVNKDSDIDNLSLTFPHLNSIVPCSHI